MPSRIKTRQTTYRAPTPDDQILFIAKAYFIDEVNAIYQNTDDQGVRIIYQSSAKTIKELLKLVDMYGMEVLNTSLYNGEPINNENGVFFDHE